MTKFKRQIISAVAAGALALNVVTPALAATEIVISGNGSGSDNWVDLSQKSETKVDQNNTANVTTTVNADTNSGKNDANFNTGGDTVISTGKATSNVDIKNALNSNTAEVNCCAAGDTEVKIDGNGAKSDNTVLLEQKTANKVYQDNVANITNVANAKANTGGNDAYKNAGGDVAIVTGDAKTDVDVSTTANVNSAKIGNSHSATPTPKASFLITGNGAGSDNYIDAALKNYNKVDQDNTANITNVANAKANAGYNDAGFNTGGEVLIGTGDATTNVDVDNSVNFNYADVDCGCEFDVLAKIAGNGAESDDHHSKHRRHHDKDENVITLDLGSVQKVYQDNLANLTNVANGKSNTGKNDAESNTGEADSDPAIITGNSTSSTNVDNSGNVNSVGDLLPFDMPEFPSNVEFSFNMAALWAFFGMSF